MKQVGVQTYDVLERGEDWSLGARGWFPNNYVEFFDEMTLFLSPHTVFSFALLSTSHTLPILLYVSTSTSSSILFRITYAIPATYFVLSKSLIAILEYNP